MVCVPNIYLIEITNTTLSVTGGIPELITMSVCRRQKQLGQNQKSKVGLRSTSKFDYQSLFDSSIVWILDDYANDYVLFSIWMIQL